MCFEAKKAVKIVNERHFFLSLIKRSEKQTIKNRIMKITNLNHKFDSLGFDLETKTNKTRY